MAVEEWDPTCRDCRAALRATAVCCEAGGPRFESVTAQHFFIAYPQNTLGRKISLGCARVTVFRIFGARSHQSPTRGDCNHSVRRDRTSSMCKVLAFRAHYGGKNDRQEPQLFIKAFSNRHPSTIFLRACIPRMRRKHFVYFSHPGKAWHHHRSDQSRRFTL